MKKKFCLALAALALICASLASQTHTAVPLGDPVYYVLEQAQMRGLCGNLPEAKPYTRAAVLKYIEEILSHYGTRSLAASERRVLEEYRTAFSPPRPGKDNASYYFEHITEDGFRITGNMGLSVDLLISNGIYTQEGESVFSTDNWINFDLEGDIGYRFSYGMSVYGGVMRAPRSELGTYNTYYEGFAHVRGDIENQVLTSYSEPLSFFPYAYRKRWDAFVWDYRDISNSGQLPWPETVSIGYGMMGELSGTLFKERLNYRFGRLYREWGAMSNGSSLVLNQAARPFIAVEATFKPIDWFAFSTMTGILEYYNLHNLKDSAESSQNAFSIYMVEFNYKSYFHIDFGSAAVWPKRLELGYPFPLFDNFFYQNNIGDFDNMAIFLNLKGQYPGFGKAWISLFLDEANPGSGFSDLSRNMFAYQLGASAAIPWLSFSSVKLSYTRNEPYNYTHTREFTPWYGNIPMETNYVNNAVSLGHYLPPNSDEILLRLETMPLVKSRLHVQYQLIRHGANYGSRAVAGSSLWSELDPSDESRAEAKKYFLRDGAYKWTHIAKFGIEHGLLMSGVPVRLFGEAGLVYSYFTDISGEIRAGRIDPPSAKSSHSIIDTPEYPHSTAIIATIGVSILK